MARWFIVSLLFVLTFIYSVYLKKTSMVVVISDKIRQYEELGKVKVVSSRNGSNIILAGQVELKSGVNLANEIVSRFVPQGKLQNRIRITDTFSRLGIEDKNKEKILSFAGGNNLRKGKKNFQRKKDRIIRDKKIYEINEDNISKYNNVNELETPIKNVTN